MELKNKLNIEIQSEKQLLDTLNSPGWKNIIEPALIEKFNTILNSLLISEDRSKDSILVERLRSVYSLFDKIGSIIQLGEYSKEKLRKLKEKR